MKNDSKNSSENESKTNIFHIKNVENFCAHEGVLNSSVDYALEFANLNTDAFCLFVAKNETYSGKSFSIPISIALKYTVEEYRDLNAVSRIKQLPCIFAQRNNDFLQADTNQLAVLGRICDFYYDDKFIKISFEKYGYFKQQAINKNIDDFGLLYNDLRNQLDEDHWSICKGNLYQIIEKLEEKSEIKITWNPSVTK